MLSNKKITVLGAGMVGRTIARELAKQHLVTSIDYSTENLRRLAEKVSNSIKENIINV